jgi:membrane protein implicated in regulation of membrane protease activity
MRFIGMMAVMIIGIAATRPEFAFLRGIDLTRAAVYFIAAVFVLLLLWKSYQEYWKNSNDEPS